MSGPLPNPERSWERSSAVAAVERAEVERRVGPVETFEALSGGLSNANVAIPGERVLRIYRRDPRLVRGEAALLERGWRSFRVPRVLERGADFLVLERVAHGPLLGTAEHGAAVGRALAEIHAQSFDACGSLDDDASRVAEPFGDLFRAFREHVAGLGGGLASDLRARVLAFVDARAETIGELSRRPVLVHGDWKASEETLATGA